MKTSIKAYGPSLQYLLLGTQQTLFQMSTFVGVGAYTKTNTRLKKSDLDMKKYQLSYTFDL